jgi:hypothetical protein
VPKKQIYPQNLLPIKIADNVIANPAITAIRYKWYPRGYSEPKQTTA